MKLAFRILLFGLGIGIFAWYLANADLREVWQALEKLGWMMPLILLPYFLVYCVDTIAWSLAFSTRPNVPFWRLFLIRWAGESLNNVLPSAYVGGEALKVYLLRKQGVSVTEATSSAVISKTLQTIAQLLFICAAAVAFLFAFPAATGLRLGIEIILSMGLALALGALWLQSRGLFGVLLDLLARFHLMPAFLERRRAQFLKLDHQIAGFFRDHRDRFFLCTAAYLGGWLLDTLEIFLVGFLLGWKIDWSQALMIEAFTGIAKALGMWVPGSLGVQESGIVLIGRAVGVADPFCLAYALIRRGRETLFAGTGWLLTWIQQTSFRDSCFHFVSQPKESSNHSKPVNPSL